MKRNVLWRLSVQTRAEAEDAVAALLEARTGQIASIYADAEDANTEVTVFFRRTPGWELKSLVRNALSGLRACGVNVGSGLVSISRVRKQDWAESWKRHFKPFTVGEALLVKPGWSRRKATRHQRTVIIDPGLSFGTGQHPTTRFCLEKLAEARGAAIVQSFLDAGTGSGILAIAAAKLGYKPVKAFDFDPVAVRVAKRNAALNRVKIQFTRTDLTKGNLGPEKYDVVCANLTSDLLVTCARKLASAVQQNGALVLAGILRAETKEVIRAFAASGFSPLQRSTDEEWESLLLRRASA